MAEFTYELTDRASGLTEIVTREQGVAWLGKNWREPEEVVAEMEANATETQSKFDKVSTGWRSLTVRVK